MDPKLLETIGYIKQYMNIIHEQLINYKPYIDLNLLLIDEEDITEYLDMQKYFKAEEARRRKFSIHNAIDCFGKDTVKNLCEEKLILRDDIENYKEILKLCSPMSYERINTDYYNAIPMGTILDIFGIPHQKSRCACPLHKGDNKTGFHIKQKNNSYKCYVCGEWGKPIDFVMKFHGYTFLQSINFLKTCR